MYIERRIWGRSGFDRMFGESKLRVSELFRVTNGQNKLNATANNKLDARNSFAAMGGNTFALAV